MARFIGALVFVGLIGTAIGVGVVSQRDDRAERRLVMYEQVDQGWSWRHPASWHVQSFDEFVGNVVFTGALVTNTNHHFVHPRRPNTETTAWDLSDLPSDAVVIQFAQVDRWGIPCDRWQAFPKMGGFQPSDFPLSLHDAESSHGPPGAMSIRVLHVCIPGRPLFNVHAWLGPDASRGDWDAAAAIVASINFERSPDR